jgi:hypothetical protein
MNIEDIARKFKTLPKFIDKHPVKGYFDWITKIKEESHFVNFSEISQQCTNKSLLPLLKEIYINVKIREVQNDKLMKNAIFWELEQELGLNNIKDNGILEEIENDIKIFLKKPTSLLNDYYEYTKSLINNTTFNWLVKIKCEDLFRILEIDNEIKAAIYKTNIKIEKSFMVELPELKPDCCFVHFKGSWFKFKEICGIHTVCVTNEKMLIDKLFRQYNIAFECSKTTISGNFYFKNLLISTIALYDVCFDKFLSFVCNPKSFTTTSIKFFENDENVGNIFLNQKTVSSKSNITKKFGLDNFPVGSPYIKCTFNNITDEETLEKLKLQLSQILFFSQKNKDAILEEYKIILPPRFHNLLELDYGAVSEPEKPWSSNKIVRQTVPELFVSDYPRKCLHLPKLTDNNTNAIPFPKNDDIVPIRWYSCEHHKYAKYPGLRKNPLHNKDLFPYIPCCYVTDQRKKPNSIFNLYYNDETEKKPTKITEMTLSANKILPAGSYGEVLPIFKKYFLSFENNYFRLGVENSGNSFVKCLEFATKKSLDNRELISGLNSEIIFQMEHYFNVSIILFQNKRDFTGLAKINPYKIRLPMFPWKNKIVIILENYRNNESSSCRCELICKNNSPIFEKTEELKKLMYVHDKYNNILRVPKKNNVVGQFLLNKDISYKLVIERKQENSSRIVQGLFPFYFNVSVLEEKTKSTPNPVDSFLNASNIFNLELKKSCEKQSNNILINNYVKHFSQRRRNWIQTNNKHEQVLFHKNPKTLQFFSLENYFEYLKTIKIVKFQDHRLFDKKILNLIPITISDLLKIESFKLFEISLINSHFLRIYNYKEDTISKIVIKIDNNLFVLEDDRQ